MTGWLGEMVKVSLGAQSWQLGSGRTSEEQPQIAMGMQEHKTKEVEFVLK